jgi:hypothetical protein
MWAQALGVPEASLGMNYNGGIHPDGEAWTDTDHVSLGALSWYLRENSPLSSAPDSGSLDSRVLSDNAGP